MSTILVGLKMSHILAEGIPVDNWLNLILNNRMKTENKTKIWRRQNGIGLNQPLSRNQPSPLGKKCWVPVEQPQPVQTDIQHAAYSPRIGKRLKVKIIFTRGQTPRVEEVNDELSLDGLTSYVI